MGGAGWVASRVVPRGVSKVVRVASTARPTPSRRDPHGSAGHISGPSAQVTIFGATRCGAFWAWAIGFGGYRWGCSYTISPRTNYKEPNPKQSLDQGDYYNHQKQKCRHGIAIVSQQQTVATNPKNLWKSKKSEVDSFSFQAIIWSKN
jgi:hypothetical protein